MQFLPNQTSTHWGQDSEAFRRRDKGILQPEAVADSLLVGAIDTSAAFDLYHYLDVSDTEGIDADRILRDHHEFRHRVRLEAALCLLLEMLVGGPGRHGVEPSERWNPVLRSDDLATSPCHTGHRGREHPHRVGEDHRCVVVEGEDHALRQFPAVGGDVAAAQRHRLRRGLAISPAPKIRFGGCVLAPTLLS